jgi:hypothetical protein
MRIHAATWCAAALLAAVSFLVDQGPVFFLAMGWIVAVFGLLHLLYAEGRLNELDRGPRGPRARYVVGHLYVISRIATFMCPCLFVIPSVTLLVLLLMIAATSYYYVQLGRWLANIDRQWFNRAPRSNWPGLARFALEAVPPILLLAGSRTGRPAVYYCVAGLFLSGLIGFCVQHREPAK